jgi:rhamnosyl/mannosyltransferase
MRILHLSKFYPPDPGGLEHVVARLAEGAAAAGHEVRVVCAKGSSWWRDPREPLPPEQRNAVTVVRVSTWGVAWSQPVAPGFLAASRWPADVVYVHRPHPLADLASLLGPPRPTIVFHHADVQRQRALRLLYRPLALTVARRAAATVVATRAGLEHAADLGPAGREKAVVIPFGVDITRFLPHPTPLRPSGFPIHERGPVALFVGRLVPYKGLDVLLRAVGGSDLQVVIVGDGPLAEELHRQVERRGLRQQVALVGHVDDDVLPAYHQAADYLVLPSTSPAEMFGIALLEAMACGRPVITSDLSTGVREVNEHNVTGLVVPAGDATALRAAMERLAGDPQLRERLGTLARRRVLERFTLSQMVESHLSLCERVRSEELGVRSKESSGRSP